MLNLKNGNGRFFQPSTFVISTVELFYAHDGMRFETVLMWNGGNEDIERYFSASDAVIGHNKWCLKYGLR